MSFFPGKTAVQVFYIISGFYMSLVLNEKYINKNNSYKLFITNRLLRLYPTYWVVLLLTLTCSLIVYQASNHTSALLLSAYFHYGNTLNFASLSFLVVTNIILFFQDTVVFLGVTNGTGNLHFTTSFYSSHPQVFRFLLVPQAWTILRLNDNSISAATTYNKLREI